MKTVILLKEIYSDAFKNLGNYIVKHSFKALTWFTAIMFLIVVYAFLYRVSTGFSFSNL